MTFPRYNFWSHVLNCATERVSFFLVESLFAQSKVGKWNMAIGVEQYAKDSHDISTCF